MVVTLGEEGALWTDGSQVRPRAGRSAGRRVVDTTGAGDAFAAGLLAARLFGAGGRGARRRLPLGCRAVATPGGRPDASLTATPRPWRTIGSDAAQASADSRRRRRQTAPASQPIRRSAPSGSASARTRISTPAMPTSRSPASPTASSKARRRRRRRRRPRRRAASTVDDRVVGAQAQVAQLAAQPVDLAGHQVEPGADCLGLLVGVGLLEPAQQAAALGARRLQTVRGGHVLARHVPAGLALGAHGGERREVAQRGLEPARGDPQLEVAARSVVAGRRARSCSTKPPWRAVTRSTRRPARRSRPSGASSSARSSARSCASRRPGAKPGAGSGGSWLRGAAGRRARGGRARRRVAAALGLRHRLRRRRRCPSPLAAATHDGPPASEHGDHDQHGQAPAHAGRGRQARRRQPAAPAIPARREARLRPPAQLARELRFRLGRVGAQRERQLLELAGDRDRRAGYAAARARRRSRARSRSIVAVSSGWLLMACLSQLRHGSVQAGAHVGLGHPEHPPDLRVR